MKWATASLRLRTDANGHTTNYGYDQRRRGTLRTLPLEQSESHTYDAAGNVLTRTDFNGKTTTYTYDNVNRLRGCVERL